MALLALSGVLLVPGLAEPYLLPKATLAAVGTALVLTVPRRTGLPRSISWVLGLAALMLILSTATSASPWQAVWGRYPRYEGLLLLPVYAGALVAGARSRAWSEVHRALSQVLTPAAILVALAAVIQAIGSWGGRATSLLGNSSELGVWAVIVAVYLLGQAVDGDRLAAFGAGAAIVGVVLSSSRGALGALLIGLLVLGLARGSILRGHRGWLVAVGVGGAAVVLALLLPTSRSRLLGDSPLAWSTVEGRRWLWSDTLDLVAAHPLTGVGPSGFIDMLGAHHSLGWAANVGPANPPDSPHNVILQALAVGGVPLAALLLVLGVAWSWQAVKSLRTEAPHTAAAGAAVIAGTAALLVHFTSAATLPLLCLLAGWVAGTALPEATGTRGQLARLIPTAVVMFCAAVLAIATVDEALIATALRATDKGDASAAQQAWARAHLLRPWDTDLWLREAVASTYGATRTLLPATSCLAPTDQARTRLPLSSEAAYARAECLEVNNEIVAARVVLTESLDHDPTNLDLLLLSGVVAARDGDLIGSEALLLHAAEIAPTESAPWTDLARVYEQEGRTTDAEAAQRRADQLAK